MNTLPNSKRIQILNMLVEGSSMRTISRIVGVSINTVTKLLVKAGHACEAFHDEKVLNVHASKCNVMKFGASATPSKRT